MLIRRDQLEQLVQRPTEGLNSETKTWIDPRQAEDRAKIVKAMFALRNRNGGTITIGFNNDTLKPDPYILDGAVESLFHLDVIQGLVAKYASEPFEVEVHLHSRDCILHPVIIVPEGVRVPVVVKAEMTAEGSGKKLLLHGDLYFRTLRSNGTPSTAKIMVGDYRELLDICFENREADIGRFLRRHLGGIGGSALATLVTPEPDALTVLKDRCTALIKRGDLAFEAEAATRVVTEATLFMPSSPLTMRVALCLDPAKEGTIATKDFLRTFASGNPNYTGWPIWLDSSCFSDEQARPKVKDGSWQALILDLEAYHPHSDFMLLDPRGDFYLRRVMQDDLRRPTAKDDRLLDVMLMLYRVAEVFAVGLAEAKACGWPSEGTAGFDIRWSGLTGRSLGAWANPFLWDVASGETSHDAAAGSLTVVSLDTPTTALAPYVAQAVAPLFAAFGGYEAPMHVIEECVRRLTERRMN